MVLMNFVEFVVFKILLDLVSMQNILNATNCWYKQICKTIQRHLTFIFDVLLGSAIGFVSLLVS